MNETKINNGIKIFRDFCELSGIGVTGRVNFESVYHVVQLSACRNGFSVFYNFSRNDLENVGDEFDFFVDVAKQCLFDICCYESKIYLDLYDKNSGFDENE